jgi:hypothetical protein
MTAGDERGAFAGQAPALGIVWQVGSLELGVSVAKSAAVVVEENAPASIELPVRLRAKVEQFNRDIDQYRGAAFREMALRDEFLNPLLEELGWDVDNRAGNRYSEREVIQEDSVLIDGAQKAPDSDLLK